MMSIRQVSAAFVLLISLMGASSATAAPGGLTYLPGADRCVTSLAGDVNYADACNVAGFETLRDVEPSPDAPVVYVATGTKLVLLQRDTSTGALKQMPGTRGCWDAVDNDDCASHPFTSNLNLLFAPLEIAISGDFLLAAHANYIDVFRRGFDGTLTPVACAKERNSSLDCGSTLPSWDGPLGLTSSPDGEHLYNVRGMTAIMKYDIDPNTGVITQPASDACYSPTGTDPHNDPAWTCASFRGLDDGNGPREFAFSPDGSHLYVGGGSGMLAFGVHPETGILTQLPARAGCIGPAMYEADECAIRDNARQLYDIDLSSDGSTLFAVNRESSTGGLLVYDRAADGSLAFDTCFSHTGNTNGCVDLPNFVDKPYQLAVSPQDDSIYTFGANTSVTAFSRDRGTGALAPIPGSEGCVHREPSYGCQPRGPYPAATAIFLDPLGKFLHFGGDQSIVSMSRELPAAPSPVVAAPTPPAPAAVVPAPVEQVVKSAENLAKDLVNSTLFAPFDFGGGAKPVVKQAKLASGLPVKVTATKGTVVATMLLVRTSPNGLSAVPSAKPQLSGGAIRVGSLVIPALGGRLISDNGLGLRPGGGASARATGYASRARTRSRVVTLAGGGHSFRRDGTGSYKVRLTKQGKAALKAARKGKRKPVKVSMVTFVGKADGSTPVVYSSRTLTLK